MALVARDRLTTNDITGAILLVALSPGFEESAVLAGLSTGVRWAGPAG